MREKIIKYFIRFILLATLTVFRSFILLATLLFLAKIIYLFYLTLFLPHISPSIIHHPYFYHTDLTALKKCVKPNGATKTE